MLGKLMKYEFKSVARTLLPAYLAVLVFALLSRFVIQNDSLADIGDGVLIGILMFIYSLAIMALCIITIIIVIQRFRKNLMGDEAYLSHTLPVSIDSHIWSKAIIAFIWSIFSTLIIFISIFILVVNSDVLQSISVFLTEFPAVYNEYIKIPFPVFILESILTLSVSGITSILSFYAALSIGHQFKKHKLLGAMLAYLGISLILNILWRFSGSILYDMYDAIFSGIYYSYSYNFEALAAAINGTFIATCLISVIQGAICYFITRVLLGKRLNLE